MKHNNYPTHRRARNVEYSKSYKLLQLVTEERFRELFKKDGMYTVAKILSAELSTEISPYVVRHVRRRYNLGVTNEKENII